MDMRQNRRQQEPDIDFLIRIARSQIAGGDTKAWISASALPALIERGGEVIAQQVQETGLYTLVRYDEMLIETVVPVLPVGTIVH